MQGKNNDIASLRAMHAQANFIKLDVQTGLLFADIASGTDDPRRKETTTNVARKAYDIVSAFRRRVPLTEKDERDLDLTLLRLRAKLEKLGEIF